jgi:hypothetical protein
MEAIDGEAIIVNGRAYGYFGITPALVRLPILELLPGTEHRLNALMMLAALVLLLTFTGRVCWDVRRLTARGDSDPTSHELVAIGSFVLLVGAGSVVLYLAAFSFPYHEAILWSIAFSVAALSYAVRLAITLTASIVVRLGAACTLAILARVTVGAGAVTVAGLFFVAAALGRLFASRRVAARLGADRAQRYGARLARAIGSTDLRPLARFTWLLGVSVVVPILALMAVNYAKFESPTRIPFDDHVAYARNPERLALLDPRFGLFSPRAIPGNLVEYGRPDGLRVTSRFPFLVLKTPGQAFNPFGVVYDGVYPHAGVSVTMPAVVALGLVGAFVVSRRRRGQMIVDHRFAALRLPLVGASVTCVLTLAWKGIVPRYEADFIPLLVVAGAAGLWVIAAWNPSRRSLRRLVLGSLVVGALFSFGLNALLAIDYQHTGHETPPDVRARYREFQEDVASLL